MSAEEKRIEEQIYWYQWMVNYIPGKEIELLLSAYRLGAIIINLN